MKHISTMFLRLVILLFGVVVLGICIFFVPEIARIARLYYSSSWMIVVLCCLYGTVIPCFYALYQTWMLLRFIDQGNAFTKYSTLALKHIKWSAVTIAVIHAILLPFAYGIAEVEDAPGLILMVAVIPCAAVVIAVFAEVLQKLLLAALQMKQDNEQTE